MCLKISSVKWRQFCTGLRVLIHKGPVITGRHCASLWIWYVSRVGISHGSGSCCNVEYPLEILKLNLANVLPPISYSDSKVHGANMGPILGRQDPFRSHVDPMNFAIWIHFICLIILEFCTEHGSDTVVFCAEVHSDWATEKQRCAHEISRDFS